MRCLPFPFGKSVRGWIPLTAVHFLLPGYYEDCQFTSKTGVKMKDYHKFFRSEESNSMISRWKYPANKTIWMDHPGQRKLSPIAPNYVIQEHFRSICLLKEQCFFPGYSSVCCLVLLICNALEIRQIVTGNQKRKRILIDAGCAFKVVRLQIGKHPKDINPHS